MSAPRPYETNPFHPPSSVHVLIIAPISIYIYTKVLHLFLPYGIYNVFWYGVYFSFPHALLQKHFGRHFVIDMVQASVRNLPPVFSLQSASLC